MRAYGDCTLSDLRRSLRDEPTDCTCYTPWRSLCWELQSVQSLHQGDLCDASLRSVHCLYTEDLRLLVNHCLFKHLGSICFLVLPHPHRCKDFRISPIEDMTHTTASYIIKFMFLVWGGCKVTSKHNIFSYSKINESTLLLLHENQERKEEKRH